MKRYSYIAAVLLSVTALAVTPQDGKTQKTTAPAAQPTLAAAQEEIPDSLLHPRWKIQKTAPIDVADQIGRAHV